LAFPAIAGRGALRRRLPHRHGTGLVEQPLQPGAQDRGVGVDAEQVDGREQPGELAVPGEDAALYIRSLS
jgi:hypothetical protein